MVRNGPGYHPEPAPKEYKYPKPKKGQKVKCLACNNGKVMVGKGKIKDCSSCQGDGYIIAK